MLLFLNLKPEAKRLNSGGLDASTPNRLMLVKTSTVFPCLREFVSAKPLPDKERDPERISHRGYFVTCEDTRLLYQLFRYNVTSSHR